MIGWANKNCEFMGHTYRRDTSEIFWLILEKEYSNIDELSWATVHFHSISSLQTLERLIPRSFLPISRLAALEGGEVFLLLVISFSSSNCLQSESTTRMFGLCAEWKIRQFQPKFLFSFFWKSKCWIQIIERASFTYINVCWCWRGTLRLFIMLISSKTFPNKLRKNNIVKNSD